MAIGPREDTMIMLALFAAVPVLLAGCGLAAWRNHVPSKVRAFDLAPEFGL
jgi:hypothetical protein